MKSVIRILSIFIFLVFGSAVPLFAQSPESAGDQTGAPYFFVNSQDPEIDCLPLKSTDVKVNIAGVIADVAVTQEYQNQGKKPLEAVYVFPASTRAAVYGMILKIGERTIVAKIDEKQAARQSYENAKNNGQSASLLEQQRPNVFQMNVANILPGDVIRVELKYTELLTPEDSVYEFVYPTVVGPRYTGPQGDDPASKENWTENPYLHEGEPAKNSFDIQVHINAGLPIAKLFCETHKTKISFNGKTGADINLDESEKFSGNRDFILKYQLSGGQIESGLMRYEGDTENFFLIMMQPPKQVKVSEIPPREYIFIVDVSGSMYGFPLDTSKALLKNLIGSLKPADRFNVLLFSGGSSVMAENSLTATQENIGKAIRFIEQQQGGGGTELLPAMQKALSMAKTEGFSRTLVIATDGYVSVEKQTFDLIRDRLGEANLFAFGIGSSVNRYLIEGMARAGMGEPFIVTRPKDAGIQAEKFKTLIQTPVLTDIHVNYGQFEAYDIEPPSIPDVFARRPVIVFGKYKSKPSGEISLDGMTGDKPYHFHVDVKTAKPDNRNAALRYLWARHRIAVLADYNSIDSNEARIKEVTRLGLTYNLLTDYTSFVAIDSLKRTDGGNSTMVKQPLPLPQGVSDYAVGYCAAKSAACVQEFAASGVPYEAERQKRREMPASPTIVEKDAAKETITLALKEVTAPKGVLRETIRKKIESISSQIKSCLENAKQDLSGLNGKLNLTVEVDKTGKVTKAAINEKSENMSTELNACLTRALQTLTFPASADGASYQLELIYEFQITG